VLPRKTNSYRVPLTEMDVDAYWRRRPDVVRVDELRTPTVPVPATPKRWQT